MEVKVKGCNSWLKTARILLRSKLKGARFEVNKIEVVYFTRARFLRKCKFDVQVNGQLYVLDEIFVHVPEGSGVGIINLNNIVDVRLQDG